MSQRLPRDLLLRAVDLKKKFRSNDEIAAELGVHRDTVARNIRKYERDTYAKMIDRHAEIKADHAKKHENMASEAYRAWERSQEDAETVKTISDGVGENAGGRTERTVKGQVGDTSYLAEARAQLAAVREVIGIGKVADDEAAKANSDAVAQARERLRNHARDRKPGDNPGPHI